ncbi:hypothetical protein BC827DRAFT_543196 [Russula dissimulans]|nr:hypothetical protein BC827DRAFT_543196 [Russula dissimulans]
MKGKPPSLFYNATFITPAVGSGSNKVTTDIPQVRGLRNRHAQIQWASIGCCMYSNLLTRKKKKGTLPPCLSLWCYAVNACTTWCFFPLPHVSATEVRGVIRSYHTSWFYERVREQSGESKENTTRKGGKTRNIGTNWQCERKKILFGGNKMDREDWAGYQMTSFSFACTTQQKDGSSRANNYRKRGQGGKERGNKLLGLSAKVQHG